MPEPPPAKAIGASISERCNWVEKVSTSAHGALICHPACRVREYLPRLVSIPTSRAPTRARVVPAVTSSRSTRALTAVRPAAFLVALGWTCSPSASFRTVSFGDIIQPAIEITVTRARTMAVTM